MQMHIFCAVAAVTFMVLPPAHAAALWLGGLFVYYSVTAFGQPEHTGRREWPALQKWLGEQLERFLPQWLGECGRQEMGRGGHRFAACPAAWLLCAAQVSMLWACRSSRSSLARRIFLLDHLPACYLPACRRLLPGGAGWRQGDGAAL
jgi:hypothetical protein